MKFGNKNISSPNNVMSGGSLVLRRDEIQDAILQYIVDESNFEDASIIEYDTNLHDAGVLDSMMIVSLISFCEDMFGCNFEIAELNEEDFRSVDAIARLINRLADNRSLEDSN